MATRRELKAQTQELKAYTDEQVGALAGMIELLDVRKRVDTLDRQVAKISQALNLKF